MEPNLRACERPVPAPWLSEYHSPRAEPPIAGFVVLLVQLWPHQYIGIGKVGLDANSMKIGSTEACKSGLFL